MNNPTLAQAKDLITAELNFKAGAKKYADLWLQFRGSEKQKLEKWWVANYKNLSFGIAIKKKEESKEVYELILTPDQEAMNEEAEEVEAFDNAFNDSYDGEFDLLD